jgi:hypothetical protein
MVPDWIIRGRDRSWFQRLFIIEKIGALTKVAHFGALTKVAQ